MKTIERDVVVIGAGVTGLTTARELKAAGLTVAVLEARDRVGGRTWTDTIDGAMLELGGQWISPDQTVIKDLLAELGLETFSRYREGKSVYIAPDGTRSLYEGEIFPVSEQTEAEMRRLISLLDGLAADIGAHEPWAHPMARELDTISLEHWMHRHSDDREACANIGHFLAGGMLTKPAHSFSALQAVLMAASAGSFSNLVDEDLLLDKRVVGGMQQVSTVIAAALGDDVVLESPVRTLRWAGASVSAISDRLTVNADHAVMAVPPNLYSRVNFDPPLPRRQHQMHQHQSLGLVIKVHAVYETPFWREEGLSGTSFSPDLMVQEIYDNSNYGESRGTLVAFVPDEKADAVFALDDAERRRVILEDMAKSLGPKTLNPVVYYESDWAAEEWTRGAYAASYDLGGLHRYGADQLTPVGPIHWASSDLAGEGYQHVDGAVRIGKATAARIVGLARIAA
ncbi:MULTISPECIES: flavin monoamine oxidase family protein [unclassified Mycolicibacterium]|uniref:flavin monoamine oxidase family protein n=1 Tax=unclassified Mycolicibacterium TaxID=2636767 RepID=UPI002ED7EF20